MDDNQYWPTVTVGEIECWCLLNTPLIFGRLDLLWWIRR